MNRNLFIGTLVLLVGAAAVLLIDKGKYKGVGDELLGSNLLEETVLAKVNRIAIKSKNDEVDLKLAEGRWVISSDKNFPADASKILRALEDFSKAKVKRLASTAQAKQTDFDIGEKVVSFYGDKDQLGQFSLGKNRTGGGQYLTIGQNENTYLADKQFYFGADTESWEYKVLLDVSKDSVKSITFSPASELKKKSVQVSRAKKEDGLKVAGLAENQKEKGDPKNLDTLLTNFRFSKRLDPSNEEAKAALTSPSRVDVQIFSGLIYRIFTGSVGSETKKYFAKIEVDKGAVTPPSEATKDIERLEYLMTNWVFEIGSYQAGKFEKGFADYVEATTVSQTSEKKDKS